LPTGGGLAAAVSREELEATSAEPTRGSLALTPTASEKEGANNAALPSLGGMATTNGHCAGAETTRALLEAIAGGRRGEQLRATVAACNRGATREQIDEAFQEACARAARWCTGQTEGEVYVWLRTTTHRQLGEMRERVRHEIPVDVSNAALESADSSLASPVEVLIEREERAEIDRLSLALLDRLAERERQIAVLHSHGLTRAEIAQHLGVTPRIVKRSVERILTTGRDQLVRLVGFGCADGHELVARYAFGLAASREARRAQLHLLSCASCGTMYERLDGWRERVAALLPVPPAVEAHTDIAERVVQAGADALSSGQPPTPAGLRRHLADAVAHAREQATSAYYRTVDPTPLAGARPGAVAAVVASCLTVGSGTTYYCVQQGADPFAALAGLTRSQDREPKPKPNRAHARAAQTPAPPALTPTVAAPTPTPTPTATPTVQQPAQQPQATATPAPPPPAPEDEYEPTSPVANSGATSGRAASSQPREPAPAPAGGPGEFDGP
jgi:RNA polymerase sigma factor (sigma-70 family)